MQRNQGGRVSLLLGLGSTPLHKSVHCVVAVQIPTTINRLLCAYCLKGLLNHNKELR